MTFKSLSLASLILHKVNGKTWVDLNIRWVPGNFWDQSSSGLTSVQWDLHCKNPLPSDLPFKFGKLIIAAKYAPTMCDSSGSESIKSCSFSPLCPCLYMLMSISHEQLWDNAYISLASHRLLMLPRANFCGLVFSCVLTLTLCAVAPPFRFPPPSKQSLLISISVTSRCSHIPWQFVGWNHVVWSL